MAGNGQKNKQMKVVIAPESWLNSFFKLKSIPAVNRALIDSPWASDYVLFKLFGVF